MVGLMDDLIKLKTIQEYARLFCNDCGIVYLTKGECDEQVKEIIGTWRCPKCNSRGCLFDDSYFGLMLAQ